MPSLARLRLAIGVVLCVVYPLSSHAFPSMGRAWGMYASSALYRLRIDGDRAGTSIAIAPDSLAVDASPRTAAMLSASDRWRHGSALSLPSHLELLGRRACASGELDAVVVTLDVREGGHTETCSERTECAR